MDDNKPSQQCTVQKRENVAISQSMQYTQGSTIVHQSTADQRISRSNNISHSISAHAPPPVPTASFSSLCAEPRCGETNILANRWWQ